MKIFRFVLIAFLLSTFSFCTKKDKEPKPRSSDIISSEEMVKVLEDVYLVEGAILQKETKADNPKYYSYHYYNNVFKNHGLTKEQFIKSFNYYSDDAEEMIKILDLIITDLSQKQGVLQGGEQK